MGFRARSLFWILVFSRRSTRGWRRMASEEGDERLREPLGRRGAKARARKRQAVGDDSSLIVYTPYVPSLVMSEEPPPRPPKIGFAELNWMASPISSSPPSGGVDLGASTSSYLDVRDGLRDVRHHLGGQVLLVLGDWHIGCLSKQRTGRTARQGGF